MFWDSISRIRRRVSAIWLTDIWVTWGRLEGEAHANIAVLDSQHPKNMSHSRLPLPLFLDFDGVLHHFFPREDSSDLENARFSFLPEFEAAIRQSPRQVQIIISSTWRRSHTLSELRGFFSRDIAGLITDVTPVLGAGSGPGDRQDEVEAWLRSKKREDQEWVAIDDMPVLFRPGAAVVACDDRFGAREAALLAEAIRDPATYAKTHPVATGGGARWSFLTGS